MLVAISAGILVNALWLQPRRHPAPYFWTRDTPARIEQPDELVRAVQDALKQVGYYTGALDGVAGPQTRSAIMAFEARAGRPATGEASADLLAAIRATKRPDLATAVAPPPVSPRQPAAAPAAPVASDPLVATIQRALARAAYGAIVADGVVGPETRDAIRRFQAEHNLPVTGEISEALTIELRAAGAMDEDP